MGRPLCEQKTSNLDGQGWFRHLRFCARTFLLVPGAICSSFFRKIASKSTPKSTIETPPFPPPLPLLFSFVIRAFQRCVAGLKWTNLHGWPTSARWRFCSDFERFRRFASRLLSEIWRKMENFSKIVDLSCLCTLFACGSDEHIFRYQFLHLYHQIRREQKVKNRPKVP